MVCKKMHTGYSASNLAFDQGKVKIMRTVFCMVVGYLLGSLSPAALLSKIKKKDLREHGSGNLGTIIP